MSGLGAESLERGEGRSAHDHRHRGPAASGKGTIAQRLAEHFGLPISTPACSTAPWRVTCSTAAASPADAARSPTAAARARPATLDDPALARPAGGRGRLASSRRSRRCGRRCSTSSATSPSARAARCWTGAISARWSARTPTSSSIVTADAEVRASAAAASSRPGRAVTYEARAGRHRARDERDAAGQSPRCAARPTRTCWTPPNWI